MNLIKIPGPSRIEMICAFLPGGKWNKCNLYELHGRIRNEYGPVVQIPGPFGRSGIILTFNPKDWENIFRNEGKFPYRKSVSTLEYYRKFIRPDKFGGNVNDDGLLSGSLLTEQHQKWFSIRTKVNPIMLQPKMIKQYIRKIDEIALTFIEKIKEIRNNHTLEMPDDFENEIYKWSLESISVIALNKRICILSDDQTKHTNDTNFFHNLRKLFQLSYQLDQSTNLWKYYKTKQMKELIVVSDIVTDFIIGHIDLTLTQLEHHESTTDSDPNIHSDKSVLEKLLQINRNLAIAMVYDMLLAGIDTTATALTSCLYSLARNPVKQEQLRQECLKMLSNNSNCLTENSLTDTNIPYLRACVKESLRIMPVTSMTMRTLNEDIILSDKYLIRSGCDIGMSHILLQNDENYFINCNDFIPERWLKTDNSTSTFTNVPFTFLPFGFGARSCIGRRFAEMEIYILLIRLIATFQIDWPHSNMKILNTYLNLPADPLRFKFIDL